MRIALKKKKKKKKGNERLLFIIVNDIFTEAILHSISRLGGKTYFEIYDIAKSLENITNTVWFGANTGKL